MPKKLLRYLGPLLVVAVFLLAVGLLYRELRGYHIKDLRESLAGVSGGRLWLALLLTALNYVVLIFYDALAIRTLRQPVSAGKIAFASFTGHVAAFNFGSLLGGPSVRYRLYSAWGLSTADILRLVAIVGLTFWIGVFCLAALIFLVRPFPIPPDLGIPLETVRPLGLLLLGIALGYLLLTALRKKPLRIFRTEIEVPSLGVTLAQLGISAADLTLAAGALYILLPPDLGLGYFEFLGIYLLGLIAVVFTHVPGGVGVFELVVLKLATVGPNNSLVAALLCFRAIYYLLPLLLAMIGLGINEILLRREATRQVLREVARIFGAVAPTLISLAAFLGGAILLFSGALPIMAARLGPLQNLVPLPLVEASHFLGSLVGAALLLLSWGLQRKLDSAFWMTAALLGFGMVFSLLKGFDYEEAIVLGIVLGVLIANRRRFYRKGSLTHTRLSAGWLAAVALVVCCSLWLGLFVYQHVDYANELWWEFTFTGDAPRLLRASAGVAALLLVFGLGRLIQPRDPRLEPPGPADLAAAGAIVAASPRTQDQLALLGDKHFLFNPPRTAFIMYAISGRSWVAMGDPVGPAAELPELAWEFRELCDRYDAWPVFYQVGPENLPAYLELGLSPLKLGEEARVALGDFGLEGRSRKALRRNHNRLLRENCSFELVARGGVAALLPELKRVSDAWLVRKKAREKGFSIGFFDEAYLQHHPCAIVRQEGRVVGFANVWEAADRAELSVDLMRHTAQAPSGLMEYLFVELMLWGKRQGYRTFNLGMAPLSGMVDRPLAPLWSRVASLVLRHGESFYNFQGLRHFKEKFDPEWHPRYLASPGGLVLPVVLADLTALIGKTLKLES